MAVIDSIKAYYKLDESSGTLADSTGTYNGTNSGATYSATGKINTAMDFEKSESDYIQATGFTAFAYTNDFSFSCWIKQESQVGTNTILSFGKNTSAFEAELYVDAGTVKMRTLTNAVGNVVEISGGATSTSTWYHIVGTYNGSTKEMKIYVNGSYVINGTGTSTGATGANGLLIGEGYYQATLASTTFDGVIDEVGIWSKVLTSDEVTTLYNSGNGLSYPFTTSTTYTQNVSESFSITEDFSYVKYDSSIPRKIKIRITI